MAKTTADNPERGKKNPIIVIVRHRILASFIKKAPQTSADKKMQEVSYLPDV